MKFTVLGISAGNGVMLYPFRHNLIGNIEVRPDYYNRGENPQWALNFYGVPIYNHKSAFNLVNEEVDVIIGHPKCGNSSMFALSRGKKFTSHEGEPSLEIFLDGIKYFKPKIFAFENLEKLTESFPLEEEMEFGDTKYFLSIFSGSVSAFGNSQVSRKRLVVIGFRADIFPQHRAKNFKWPVSPPLEDLPTSDTLIQNCPDNGHKGMEPSLRGVISLYGGFQTSYIDIRDFWLSNPSHRHWTIENGNMNTAPGVYINRKGDLPLTVRKTNRQFNHHGLEMTPRELARLQGIPDEFQILDPSNCSWLKVSTLVNKGRFTIANTPPYEIGLFLSKRIKLSLLSIPKKFK